LFLNDTGAANINFTGGGSINMIGTGVIRATSSNTSTLTCALNINTTNPTGYVFGDATYPRLRIGNGGVINLLGTSIASVYSPTGHILDMRAGSSLNTNNTPTGANLPSGTQILWANLTTIVSGTQTATMVQQTTFQGNLSHSVVGGIFTVNGAKILLLGNLSCVDLRGTSTIEFSGSSTSVWSTGLYQNNVVINKSGGADVQLSGSITWGENGRSFTKTAGIVNPTTSDFIILQNKSVTVDNLNFYNFTIGNLAITSTTTVNFLNTNVVSNIMSLYYAVIFQGVGFTTTKFRYVGNNADTVTFVSGVTYTIISELIGQASSISSSCTFKSSIPSSQAYVELNIGGGQLMYNINATDIDSSGTLGVLPYTKQTIYSLGATLNNTINWSASLPTPSGGAGTVAFTFVN
jgi:hypothetical protein